MDVRTLILPVRDSYVKAFERSVREYKLNRSRQCAVEYSAGVPDDLREGMFPLPVRHDLLPLADGRPNSITVIREDKPIKITESIIAVASIPVTIRQFTWDHVELHAFGVKRSGDLAPLLDWFDRWFDRHGRRPQMAAGIHGVVHSLFGPFWTENGMTIVLDLGTATADALVDLLYAVSHLAPTAIDIMSPAAAPRKPLAWDITVPDGWERTEQTPDVPITYTRDQSVLRISIEEAAALNRTMTEAVLANDIRQIAARFGARKTAHVNGGMCPLGMYAVIEWRTLEHGTIRLWMLTNQRDIITASLIGDDLTERDVRQITDCVMAIVPKAHQ
jgi:hypothetical protein